MSIMHFGGTSIAAIDPVSGNVVLTNRTFSSSEQQTGGVANVLEVLLDFNSDGTAKRAVAVNGIVPTATDYNATDWWLLKPVAGIGNDYEIFVSADISNLNGGTFIGVLDTWSTIIGNQYDLVYNSEVVSTSTVILTVSIRDVATQTLQDTGTFTLTCDYFI